MLHGNFVQMNIDRPVYTRNRYNLYYHNGYRHLRGCLFYLSGVQKNARCSDSPSLVGMDFP